MNPPELPKFCKATISTALCMFGAGVMWLVCWRWHDAQVFWLGGWFCFWISQLEDIAKGKL